MHTVSYKTQGPGSAKTSGVADSLQSVGPELKAEFPLGVHHKPKTGGGTPQFRPPHPPFVETFLPR